MKRKCLFIRDALALSVPITAFSGLYAAVLTKVERNRLLPAGVPLL